MPFARYFNSRLLCGRFTVGISCSRNRERHFAPGKGSDDLMPENSKPPFTSHYGNAMGLAVELVATTAVGAFLGWLIDGWLNTRVIFLFVFALLGGAAGVLRLYRTYGTDKVD